MIELTVDFSLLILDEFNGAVVEDRGIWFQVNQRLIRPMRKPDGYYVFQKVEGESFQVEVFAPCYQPQTAHIVRSQLNPAKPVVRLRLIRQRSGAFRDCDWVSGSFQANRMVYIFQEGEPALRLQSEVREENGSRVLTLGYMVQRRIGRRFAIGETTSRETFVITDQAKTVGAYITDKVFRRSYKQGNPVVRAYASRCKPDGSFDIPVEPGLGGKQWDIWHCDKEAGKWAPV